MDIED
jgi:hypothetical protein